MMGSLEMVPLSTFSTNAFDYNIALQSNCLVQEPCQTVSKCRWNTLQRWASSSKYLFWMIKRNLVWPYRVTIHFMRRTNRNASHQTYCSTVKANYTFGGRCTASCRCRGGRIGVVCHGESHPNYRTSTVRASFLLCLYHHHHPTIKLISRIFNHSKRAYRRWDIVDYKCAIHLHWSIAITDMVLLQGCYMR